MRRTLPTGPEPQGRRRHLFGVVETTPPAAALLAEDGSHCRTRPIREVLGEILFGGIGHPRPDQAAKMRVLATLERRTKEAAGPALERAGLSTDPETRARPPPPRSCPARWP